MDEEEYLSKEVYAKFGLAYFFSECIHRQLCNYFVFKDLPLPTETLRSRLEEKMKYAYSLTLGSVYNAVKDNFANDFRVQMDKVILKRNYLAHHFWFERVHMMSSIDNLKILINELEEYIQTFKETDKKLSFEYPVELEKIGVTQEMFNEELRKVYDGEPYEPLPNLRYPRKYEKIINVWDAPLKNNKKALVFESDDGVFWQICDIGLCWFYGEKKHDWTMNEKLMKYFPSKIEARPKIEKPWNFSLVLGKNINLNVLKKDGESGITYKIVQT